MFKHIILLLIFGLALSKANGSESSLKVVSANSGVSAKSSSGEIIRLKSGSTVGYSDKIIVAEKGYMVVLCNNGKPLEIKQAGEYKCSSLIDNCAKITSSGFKDFTEWLSSNMIKEKTDKGTMMKNLGAVSRMSSGSKKVNTMIPVSKIIDRNITLVWNTLRLKLGSPNGLKNDEKQTYLVKIFDSRGEQLQTIESSDTLCSIELPVELIDTVSYYWQVEAKGYPRTISNVSALVFTGESERLKISEKVNFIKSEFDLNDSPYANFILANYYEENGYYIDAYLHYVRSTSISEPPEEYLERYKEFLESQKSVE